MTVAAAAAVVVVAVVVVVVAVVVVVVADAEVQAVNFLRWLLLLLICQGQKKTQTDAGKVFVAVATEKKQVVVLSKKFLETMG